MHRRVRTLLVGRDQRRDLAVARRVPRRLSRGVAPGQLRLMRSSGGIMGADEARRFPARAALSGPAGGVVASRELARTPEARHGGRVRHGRHLDGRLPGDTRAVVDQRPAARRPAHCGTVGGRAHHRLRRRQHRQHRRRRRTRGRAGERGRRPGASVLRPRRPTHGDRRTHGAGTHGRRDPARRRLPRRPDSPRGPWRSSARRSVSDCVGQPRESSRSPRWRWRALCW